MNLKYMKLYSPITGQLHLSCYLRSSRGLLKDNSCYTQSCKEKCHVFIFPLSNLLLSMWASILLGSQKEGTEAHNFSLIQLSYSNKVKGYGAYCGRKVQSVPTPCSSGRQSLVCGEWYWSLKPGREGSPVRVGPFPSPLILPSGWAAPSLMIPEV